MKNRVVITGVGVIAPNGIGKEEFWKALREGKSGIKKISRFDASGYPCQVAGEVTNFDPLEYMDSKAVKRMDRFSQFALVCAKMAVEDAGLQSGNGVLENASVVVGSAIGGIPMAEDQHILFLEKGMKRISPYLAISLFTGSASGQISIALGIKGYSNVIGGACAAGTDAVGYSFDIIRKGETSLVIAGGAEAPLAPLTFGSFCIIDALSKINGNPERASRPFDAERNGFVMSEGAGILVLEELTHAVKRGAHIYAEIVGYGTRYDSFHMVQPSPNGEEAGNAVIMSLHDAEISPDKIDYINAHGTSTPLNDKTETIVAKRVFGERAYKIPISSTKSMIGHTLGAAGAIEAIVSALTLKDQFIHPTINYEYPDPDCDLDYVPQVGRPAKINYMLTNSYGFGGKNSALILKKVSFMKTLVTGATGFIGTYLVDALAKTGREVTCCIRKTSNTSKLEPLGVKLVYGDLLDKDSLKQNLKGMECVFHLGGEVYCSNPETFYTTNINSTRNILDASLENKVGKIIFFSSIAAMGPNYNKNQRLNEDDSCHPVSPYGISKYMCEQLLCKFAQKFKLPVVIVRPPVVYGPGVNSSSRVLELIRNIKKGIVLVPGDGNNRISLCYVENLIKGTLLAEKRADLSAKTYIFTDGRSYTYNELINAVTKELKIQVRKVFIPQIVLRAGINFAKYARKMFLMPASISLSRLEEGIYSWDCDIARAREELSYSPDVELNEGLTKTIKWCINNNLC